MKIISEQILNLPYGYQIRLSVNKTDDGCFVWEVSGVTSETCPPFVLASGTAITSDLANLAGLAFIKALSQ